MMAFAMACARHDLFAGIGTISAGMPKHVFESCRLAEPMLLVMINGDGETCCRMPAVTSAIPAPSSEHRAPTDTYSTRDGKHVLERLEWLNGQTQLA
jgi:poly(3-hydroxybutyrate) depolymerase